MTARRPAATRDVATFACELSISAVPYEAALVTDLIAELSARLESVPVWEGHSEPASGENGPTLAAGRSRIALVLHQRLWQADDSTRSDALLLQERVREQPGSVCVATLDGAPVPGWLAGARCCDLSTEGLHGAAAFALDAIASAGGSLAADAPPPASPSSPRWPDGPQPFLSQPRALTTLKREVDALVAALEAHLEDRRARQPDRPFELHVRPQRIIARLDDVAVSFSWLPGRMPIVGDGRLMVIEWSGVASEARGASPLRSATQRRERVYRAEGGDPAHWCWRVDDTHGRAYSTANLVADWLASASADAAPAQE